MGKIHCETHYLERYKGHSPTINRSTITKFPEIKSRPTTATPKSQSTTTKSGVFACEICGKDNTGGRTQKVLERLRKHHNGCFRDPNLSDWRIDSAFDARGCNGGCTYFWLCGKLQHLC